MRRSLSATLHDGTLDRVVIEDGLVTLTFDVPHVRAAASLGDDARFVLQARGSVSLAALAWNDPATPRPTRSETPEALVWPKLGTMRSLDWEVFAASLAPSGLAVVEAELDRSEGEGEGGGAREVMLMRGNLLHPPPYAWVEIRVEADSLAFARETGEAIALGVLEALGDAYGEAWSARRAK